MRISWIVLVLLAVCETGCISTIPQKQELKYKPRVFVIGDSICVGIPTNSKSKGWAYYLKNDYADKIEVNVVPENSGNTNKILEKLNEWLNNEYYDVIVFNSGLHDIKWGKVITDRRAIEPEEYKQNLEKIVERLSNTGASLVWVNTTPVPDNSQRRHKGDEILYNNIAEEIMNRYNIKICDAHSFVQPFENYSLNYSLGEVHMNNNAYRKIAAEVFFCIESLTLSANKADSYKPLSMTLNDLQVDFMPNGYVNLKTNSQNIVKISPILTSLAFEEKTPFTTVKELDFSFNSTIDILKKTGWIFSDNRISISDALSKHPNSLFFDLNETRKNECSALTPPINVSKGSTYSISIEWINNENVYSTKGPGGHGCWLSLYTQPDGKGECTNEVFVKPTGETLDKQITEKSFSPPDSTKSFRLLLRARKDAKGSFFIPNIKIKEMRQEEKFAISGKTDWKTLSSSSEKTIVQGLSENEFSINKMIYNIDHTTQNVNCEIQIKYKKSQKIRDEKITLNIPSDGGKIITRDMRLTKLEPNTKYWIDEHTPKFLIIENGFSICNTSDIIGMEVETQKNLAHVSLYFDDYESHPFYRFPKSPDGKTKTSKVSYCETIRKPGDIANYQFEFNLNRTSNSNVIALSRLPNGYDAAIVVTEHADGAKESRDLAIAYGTDDTLDSNFARRGFIGYGLTWTKSIFVLNTEDLSLYDRLHKQGVEIVPHSVYADYSIERARVKKGLEILKERYNPKTWIDHSAGGDIEHLEALASQGSVPDSEYYIMDLLRKYGYRYAWAYIDYPPESNNINIFAPTKKSFKTPLLWKNNQFDPEESPDKCIYLWATFGTAYDIHERACPTNIDKLIQEHGIGLLHEYLGHARSQGKAWNKKGDHLYISDAFDKSLAYMAQKQQEGILWVTTISNLAEYLLNRKKIKINPITENTFVIKNESYQSLKACTIFAYPSPKKAFINDNELQIESSNPEFAKIVLPELKARTSYTIVLKND